MSKIIGNTTATPVPRSDWNQTDKKRPDFIRNKPELGAISEKDIIDKSDLTTDIQSSLEEIDTKANVVTLTTEEYTALEEAEATNANTLYMITDAEEEIDLSEYATKEYVETFKTEIQGDLDNTVKSVNGVTPNENGNVEISNATDEQVSSAVAAYLTENPFDGSGWSVNAKTLLVTILRNAVYNTDQSANITALETELSVTEQEPHTHSYTSSITTEATCTTTGIRTYTCSCGNSYTETIPVIAHNYVDGICTTCGEEDPDYNPEVTLSSISAVYSGGDVVVGTAITDLTGIVVTAIYSDGSTQTVTDYTLSGEITEGSNTISVSYDGKTTTFTVTGVAESSGGDEPSGEVTELTIRVGGKAQTLYTDEGNTIYSGAVNNRWISEKLAKVDTEVTIAILYGTNNDGIYQSVGCVADDLSTESHYVERIGHAQDTEYTYTYTVKAGYRLGIFNSNGGSPNSITVTTTTPDDWEDVVNDNRFNGEYVVGMVSSSTGDVNAVVTSCKTTDYIACADISEIYTLVIRSNKKHMHQVGTAFYNADKQFISGVNSIAPTTEITPITVPDGAAYIRCSYGGAYGTSDPIYIGASANTDATTFVTLSTLVE